MLTVAPACNPLPANRLAGGRGAGGREARRLLLPLWAGHAVTQISVHRPRFLKSGPGLTSKTANQGHQMARLTFSPRRRCAWRVLSCRAGGGVAGSAPGVAAHGVSFRVGRVVVAGSAPGVAAHGVSFRVGRVVVGVSPRRRCAWRVLSCRAGGGGGVSPRRRCAWRVLSCRAGGGGGVSPRRRCAWRVLSCRAGGGGGVSPRRRCAWRVLSCRAGGGVAGSAPGVAASGILPLLQLSEAPRSMRPGYEGDKCEVCRKYRSTG